MGIATAWTFDEFFRRTSIKPGYIQEMAVLHAERRARLPKSFPTVIPKNERAYLDAPKLVHFTSIGDVDRWWLGRMRLHDAFLFHADNRKGFRKLFGHPTCRLLNRADAPIWHFSNGFFLITARGKGSSLEVPTGTSAHAVKTFMRPIIYSLGVFQEAGG